MKVTYSILLAGIFLIFGFLNCTAQNKFIPGYVITNAKDTTHGEINLKNTVALTQSCEFRLNGNSQIQIYKPSDILGYKFSNGRYFVSRAVDLEGEKQVFLEYLVNGIADLYYYEELNRSMYFIEKDSSGMALLESFELRTINEYGDEKSRTVDSYKGVMKYIFQDATLEKEIETSRLNHKSLIDLTVDYHEKACPEEVCLQYSKITKNRFWLSPAISLGRSFLTQKYGADIAPSVNINPGLYLSVNSIKGRRRLNTILGLQYVSGNYQGDYSFIYGRFEYEKTYFATIDISSIRIPVQIQYNLYPESKLQPFFSMGIDAYWITKFDYRLQNYSNGEPEYDYEENINIQKMNIGFNAGIGASYNLGKYSKVFAKLEYLFSMPPGNYDYEFDYIRIHSLFFTGGMMFNIDR